MRLVDARGTGAAGATLGKPYPGNGRTLRSLLWLTVFSARLRLATVPANRVLESDRTIAFRDINPQAPTHVLVITREHHANLAAVARAGDGLLDELAARRTGGGGRGHRLARVPRVFTSGPQAGQTVDHVQHTFSAAARSAGRRADRRSGMASGDPADGILFPLANGLTENGQACRTPPGAITRISRRGAIDGNFIGSPHTGQGAAVAASAGGGRSQVKIVIPDEYPMVSLLGSRDELLHVVEQAFGADIHVRGNEITVTGEPQENTLVTALFEELIALLGSGAELSADMIERSLGMLRRKSGVGPADVLTQGILSARGRTIRPKTLNQKRYVDAIDKHTIVFAIGPAGTGKTYLAMAKAVKALQAKEVNRIILTRPAVEAGERLGFLPGTLFDKIDPYLRPLYDALHDMLDPDSIPRLTAAGTIEIAPLAYMRGRTLMTRSSSWTRRRTPRRSR